jgi:hypothetical protein
MVENEAIDDWSWEVVSSEFKLIQNSRLESKSIALENRVISEYLTVKCRGCLENPCFNYHPGQKIRRRLISLGSGKWNYSSKRCLIPKCYNQTCPFAHTTEESLFHPEKYKKERCKYQLKNGECETYGYFCPYQHGELDIIEKTSEDFDLESFKTIKCEIKHQHVYSSCIYYHDHLKKTDRRRSLKIFNYSLEICPDNENCKNGDSCIFCHSDIEFKYHPSRFKTRPCIYRENCRDKKTCSYFHEGFGDKMILQVKEYKRVLDKLQEKLEISRKIQKVTSALDRFICSACREVKSEVVMKCGHSRCSECKMTSYCFLCECETYLLVKIKFE